MIMCVFPCLNCVALAGRPAHCGTSTHRGYHGKGPPDMGILIYMLFTVVCSLALSTVAFMVGRCGRRLPVDGILPRTVHSTRWGDDSPRRN